MLLATGLHPDPLEEFTHSPSPLTTAWQEGIRRGERMGEREEDREKKGEGTWKYKGDFASTIKRGNSRHFLTYISSFFPL